MGKHVDKPGGRHRKPDPDEETRYISKAERKRIIDKDPNKKPRHAKKEDE